MNILNGLEAVDINTAFNLIWSRLDGVSKKGNPALKNGLPKTERTTRYAFGQMVKDGQLHKNEFLVNGHNRFLYSRDPGLNKATIVRCWQTCDLMTHCVAQGYKVFWELPTDENVTVIQPQNSTPKPGRFYAVKEANHVHVCVFDHSGAVDLPMAPSGEKLAIRLPELWDAQLSKWTALSAESKAAISRARKSGYRLVKFGGSAGHCVRA